MIAQTLKSLFITLIIFYGAFSLFRWNSSGSQNFSPQQSQTATASSGEAEGLSLPALTGLVKQVRSGQELEYQLNREGGVNNLDLNDDQKVDYIRVEEFGDKSGKLGYSLTTQPAKGETQEIATVTLEKNGESAEIQVTGDETIYGRNAVYQDSAPLERPQEQRATTQMPPQHTGPIAHNYFSPYPLWISPFYFGFYPPFFSFYSPLYGPRYMQRVSRYRSPSTRTGRNAFQARSNRRIKSPNAGKRASKGISRKFQSRRASGRSGAFGRSRNLNRGGRSLNRSTTRRGFSQRRSSSFGRRSFSRGFSRRGGFGRSFGRSFGRGFGGFRRR